MIGKTILYTGRCRNNAAVSESIDCQEEERIDLLPEVTDKRWLPAFFHALYLLSIKLSMFCNLGYDMNVMEILITNSNSFYFIKNLALLWEKYVKKYGIFVDKRTYVWYTKSIMLLF